MWDHDHRQHRFGLDKKLALEGQGNFYSRRRTPVRDSRLSYVVLVDKDTNKAIENIYHMTCHEKLLMVVFLLLFITECDIEFVDPSKYTPPDDGLPMKNGIEEDPYEKIVRGNLQFLDKQKVFCNLGTHSFFLYSPFFFSFFDSNFCHTISQGGR